MNSNAETPTHPVEALLNAAYINLKTLRERHCTLTRSGIDSDHLPREEALMAFCLLGDHERADLLEKIGEHWAILHSKGLVRGEIEVASSPELRLIAHALPFIDAIDDVWQRLSNAELAPEAPQQILRCATGVSGLWGQIARLHFEAQDVLYLLIAPDPIFGLQPALVAAEANGWCVGSFSFSIDTGSITISLLQRSGDLFRHVIHAVVEGDA